MEVLFESEKSASVIIRKVFNYRNPRSHDIWLLIGPIKVRSDEVISFGSNESTVGQVSVHGVSSGGDIGHDKEATGSHPGPSLYV